MLIPRGKGATEMKKNASEKDSVSKIETNEITRNEVVPKMLNAQKKNTAESYSPLFMKLELRF